MGYNALIAVNLSNHYTRRVTHSPEEYFDMISPYDYDTIIDKYHEFERYENEFNNE